MLAVIYHGVNGLRITLMDTRPAVEVPTRNDLGHVCADRTALRARLRHHGLPRAG
jgi:succinate dehydrogenase/fumarate reductase cytochrome b subunit